MQNINDILGSEIFLLIVACVRVFHVNVVPMLCLCLLVL